MDRLALAAYHGLDIGVLLARKAASHAERTFVVWQPFDQPATTLSYGEVHAQASAVASGLRARGVARGDRVLIHLDNSAEFVVAWFGCALAGAVSVTTNTRSTGDELTYFCDDSAPVGAITQPSYAELVTSSGPSLRWIVVTDHNAGVMAEPGARPVRGDGFADLMVHDAPMDALPVDPMADLTILYTSGTTSRPKGVVWTHANGLWAAQVNAAHETLRPDDRHLVYLPLFHANALGYGLLASLWVGASVVLTPKWSTSRFWPISIEHGCTWTSLIGLSYRAIAASELPGRHSFRLFGAGTGSPPLDRRLDVRTIGWFGMTETVSHPIVGSPFVADQPLSMGRPAPEYGVAVVDDRGDQLVEPGETGHLLVRGSPGVSLFAEYLNQPEATAEAFDSGGWFKTGDLVVRNSDGSLSYADRTKDMLKVGAENVAASEIERVLTASGLVAEAAVVGTPDVKLDEVPVAFVIPRAVGGADPAGLLAACRAKLADFKVPRAIHVVSEFPRSTLHKVDKAELRRVARGTPGQIRRAADQWIVDSGVDDT